MSSFNNGLSAALDSPSRRLANNSFVVVSSPILPHTVHSSSSSTSISSGQFLSAEAEEIMELVNKNKDTSSIPIIGSGTISLWRMRVIKFVFY